MMADRTDFFFRQRVQESELDVAFALLEQADRDFASDLGIYGIIAGAEPAPHSPVPDLSIDVTAPGRAYDRLGRRIFLATQQVVDCSMDELGLPTAVTMEGQARWLSIFVRFDRSLTDVRTDGNAQEVYFRRNEGFTFVVRQAPSGPLEAIERVPFVPDELLVADVILQHGQTQIQQEHIDRTRRQVFVFSSGEAISVESGGWGALRPLRATVQASFDAVDQVLSTLGGDVSQNVQAILEQQVRERLTHPGQEGTPQATAPNYALPSSTLSDAVSFLLGEVNKRVARAGDRILGLHIGESSVTPTPNTLTVGDQDFGLLGQANPEVKFDATTFIRYIRSLGRLMFVIRESDVFTLNATDGGVQVSSIGGTFLEDTLQGSKLFNGLYLQSRSRRAESTLIIDEGRTDGVAGVEIRSTARSGKGLRLTNPTENKTAEYAQINLEPLQGNTRNRFPSRDVKAGDIFCSNHNPARLYFYNGNTWVQLG